MVTESNDLALLSRQQAAKRMGISPGNLRNLINNGAIGVLKMGQREKIPQRELIRFLDENTVRSNRELDNHLYAETNPNDILITRERPADSMGGDAILTELLNEMKEV